MRVLLVVPTYNEADNVVALVEGIRVTVPEVDILIADDNSPDGTGAIADHLAARDPQVSVLHRPTKAGLGAAYIDGFKVGLARGYDVIGEMDSDGSHQPRHLPALLEAVRAGADLVIGSRWVPNGRVVNWPWVRRMLSQWGNRYARLMLGFPIRDATSGFRLFTAEALEAADLDAVVSSGYCFQIDLAWRVWLAGLTVREVPIEFVDRVHGASKMSGAIAWESLRRVTIWGLRSKRGADRRQLEVVS